ncbi:EF-hand like [Lecanosticta acicola]|uniref:EF-hand like n=1 Tax=Lecanosticta acicola TaxID=111012 RepID=A0AAI9ECY9_9PEZI|nr:EF-hand like [Lecanosticta acicola]
MSIRQNPFKRQSTLSPAPSTSPTKGPSTLSPTKPNSLSPEKTSPFVRRPSQIGNTSERPSSPFARPSSSLSIPASPSRKTSSASQNDAPLSPSLRSPSLLRQSSVSPAPEEPETPVVAPSWRAPVDGARPSSEELLEDSPFYMPPSPANLRPTAQRTVTSSTATTIKPPASAARAKPPSSPPKLNAPGGYNHIPQPLLHSMRESFEVLDSGNSGFVNSAAVSEMLSQMGMDNTPATLKDFFPPNGPAQLNLARYLDVLSGPSADLSQNDELRAAFEAFDLDDSGQIDMSTLRDALLHTTPQPGEDTIHLSEREVDGILGEFTSRRAFGSRGLHAPKGKGDVFRYRDFMASVNGGAAANGTEAAMIA